MNEQEPKSEERDHARMPNRPQPKAGDTVIGLTDEQRAIISERRDASHGNPREVVGAFTDAPTELPGGISVSPISLGHFLVLEKLEHPMADPHPAKDEGDEMSNGDLLAGIFVLTRPAKESRLLLKQGRQAFDEAVDTFADEIPLANLPKLAAVVNRSMSEAFATIIPDEKKTEMAPQENLPGSAGG